MTDNSDLYQSCFYSVSLSTSRYSLQFVFPADKYIINIIFYNHKNRLSFISITIGLIFLPGKTLLDVQLGDI